MMMLNEPQLAGRKASDASKRMRIVMAVLVTIACLLATVLAVAGSPAAPGSKSPEDERAGTGLGGWGSWESGKRTSPTARHEKKPSAVSHAAGSQLKSSLATAPLVKCPCDPPDMLVADRCTDEGESEPCKHLTD